MKTPDTAMLGTIIAEILAEGCSLQELFKLKALLHQISATLHTIIEEKK
ncbi:MAG: hypothetical protein LBN07_00650 [Christensenellaceae bacterium]|jgi:hypothetical protein|nr:hypothetical protein [Christensenellaceae bacterium]